MECDGCGSEPTNETFVISCDGEGYTPPPSPTLDTAIGGNATSFPAAVTDGAASNSAFSRRGWGGAAVGVSKSCITIVAGLSTAAATVVAVALLA